MKDIISINRQFLIIAREQAKSKLFVDGGFDVSTGLSGSMLDLLGKMSMDEIEELANAGISLFTLRVTEKQINSYLENIKGKKRAAYLLAGLSENH